MFGRFLTEVFEGSPIMELCRTPFRELVKFSSFQKIIVENLAWGIEVRGQF